SGLSWQAWNDNFLTQEQRPYDDVEVEVFEFAVITTIDKYWVETYDNRGKKIIEEKKSRPVYKTADGKNTYEPQDGKSRVISKRIEVVFEGVYNKATDNLLSWDMQKDMIKPHRALQSVMLPYAVYMPDNHQMQNTTIVERVIPDIKEIILTRLKLQQIIIKLRPDGIIVDIDGLDDVDIGLGRKSTPLELVSVYNQTGVLYKRGVNEAGEPIGDPIRSVENNNTVSKIQSLITTYNFYLQSLREALGTNEITEGQAPNPRLGKQVMDNSIHLSNRATEFIYYAYTK